MYRGTNLEELKASLPPEYSEVPWFSYSQLSTADTCGYKWYVKYQLKLKHQSSNTTRLDIGDFVHQFLHDLYARIASGEVSGPQEWADRFLDATLMQIVDGLKFLDQVKPAETAFKIIRRYCQSDNLRGHRPVGTEEHFFVMVTLPDGRRFVLQGYVDLITMDLHDRVWVWDHKAPEGMWRPRREWNAIQLPLYRILMNSTGMSVYGVIINLINSYDYKHFEKEPDDKLYKRIEQVHTPAQLNNIWAEFQALAAFTLDIREGKVPVRRSLQDHICQNCDLLVPCNAHLSGEQLETAVALNSNRNVHFRSLPVGTGVTLDLEDI